MQLHLILIDINLKVKNKAEKHSPKLTIYFKTCPVAQSCPTLCDPMDCNRLRLPFPSLSPGVCKFTNQTQKIQDKPKTRGGSSHNGCRRPGAQSGKLQMLGRKAKAFPAFIAQIFSVKEKPEVFKRQGRKQRQRRSACLQCHQGIATETRKRNEQFLSLTAYVTESQRPWPNLMTQYMCFISNLIK